MEGCTTRSQYQRIQIKLLLPAFLRDISWRLTRLGAETLDAIVSNEFIWLMGRPASAEFPLIQEKLSLSVKCRPSWLFRLILLWLPLFNTCPLFTADVTPPYVPTFSLKFEFPMAFLPFLDDVTNIVISSAIVLSGTVSSSPNMDPMSTPPGVFAMSEFILQDCKYRGI